MLFYLFSPEGPFQCFLTRRNIPDTQTWCSPAGAAVWVHSQRRRASKWDGDKASGSQRLHPHCLHFCFCAVFVVWGQILRHLAVFVPATPPCLLPPQPSLLVAKSLMTRFPKLAAGAFLLSGNTGAGRVYRRRRRPAAAVRAFHTVDKCLKNSNNLLQNNPKSCCGHEDLVLFVLSELQSSGALGSAPSCHVKIA